MGMFTSSKSYVGVDIGSASIKIVELDKIHSGAKLINYGFSETQKIVTNNWQEDEKLTAEIINKIYKKSGIKSRNAIAALPTFSVFSSILNLSSVSKKELASSIHWEARKVIPLPLEEMILDWKIIKDGKSKSNIQVLLTGAPKNLVKKYINIFKEAQINLISLETETFSLIRSLIGNDKSTIMIVEIGSNTTDVSIVDKGIPMLNRSIDIGGMTITKAISKNLNIDIEKAEQFKYDLGIGMNNLETDVIPQIIIDTVEPIINEIKYAINLFSSKDKQKTEKIILSGGSVMLPNLANYLSKILDINVIVGDPWSRIEYPEDLKPLLHEIGPRLSVAIGLAMREI